MCNMVEVFRADGKKLFCETKAELREAIGAEPVKNKHYKTWDDSDCLCPCDMKATAKVAGFGLHQAGGMEYLMTAKYETPNALGEGRERGILREASSGEAATSTDGLEGNGT